MGLAPALDLRPAVANDTAPANLAAEQALLGAVLYDNGAYERLSDALRAEHFFEPFHGRLFAALEAKISRGQLADPTLLADQFQRDEAFRELGGIRYLANLVDGAPPGARAPDYAREVYDLALRRELIRIGGEIARTADEGDPDMSARDMIEGAEQQLFGLAEKGHGRGAGPVNFATNLTSALEAAAEAYGRDGALTGLSTGLADLDAKLGGLHPSDLIIIAARPSMGKSALLANIAFHVARRYAWEPTADGGRKTTSGGVALVFSLEMSGPQLSMRIAAEVSGVPSDKIRKGQITGAEYARLRDATLEIQEAPLFIDDTGGLSIAKLRTRARRLQRTVGLDLICVDYLQLVTPSSTRRGENRVNEVSEVTMELKALAKELNVPVIAAAQLSRQVETRDDKRPFLADLRESGSIEQDADVVMFIYREAYYLERGEPAPGTDAHHAWQVKMDDAAGVAELIIGKQRHGPIGTVRTHFDETLTKFSSLAKPSHMPESVRFPYGDR